MDDVTIPSAAPQDYPIAPPTPQVYLCRWDYDSAAAFTAAIQRYKGAGYIVWTDQGRWPVPAG